MEEYKKEQDRTELPEETVEETNEVGFFKDNRGVGVIEIVLILVIIFTIYKGCK